MIKPVNGHLVIEPLPRSSFMQSMGTTFQEVGTVIEVSHELDERTINNSHAASGEVQRIPGKVKRGDKVYFDAWLAAKYPKNESEFYWLVKWEDVRAIEHAEVPE